MSTQMKDIVIKCVGLSCMGLSCLLGGCSQAKVPDEATRIPHGYVYYLDGAGGGRELRNWGGGVKQGLLTAGYPGAGEMFPWNTGLGVIADQNASVEYKRSKASELAARIQEYRKQQPGAPITVIGLSAGTAIAVFTLEALPVDCQVDNVVLLGASISASYDLTQALQRVRNRMYVFTSENDAVLAFLVPMSGTADRQKNAASAGLSGFQVPNRASPQTQAQYAKLSNIAWRPEFEQAGDRGGHTDTVKAPFVRQYIAPLIMQVGGRAAPAPVPETRKVRNPDYDRWSDFAAGAWAAFEGHQIIQGKQSPVRIVVRLVSRHADTVTVERTYRVLDAAPGEPLLVQTFVSAINILPQEHPLTSPGAKVMSLPGSRVEVAGQSIDCEVQSIEAHGQFPEWGRDVVATVYINRSVPGGIVKISLKSHRQNEPFEFSGQLVEYGVPGKTTPPGK